MLISCPIILSYNYVKIPATASQPAKLYTELPQFTFFNSAPYKPPPRIFMGELLKYVKYKCMIRQ